MTAELKTRRPTGKPPWPMVLIAGSQKTGKSYSAAVASASDLIDRTFWIGIGEDDPDEYGSIPGVRFEIVEHDGTYRGILGAIDAACAVPSNPNKPNMIVIDSATRLWNLLIDDAQNIANRRAAAKNKSGEADITMDLWNKARAQWENVLLLLQSHNGPSIITSRFEQVNVVENGRPTGKQQWKVKAQKGLPYDVGVVVEMPARGKAYLTNVRSTVLQLNAGEHREYHDFTVEKLWRDLGLTRGTSARQYAAPRVNAAPDAPADPATGELWPETKQAGAAA